MLPKFTHIVASWDTAFENKTTSDYVVGQLWGVAGSDRYLLHSYRRHTNLQGTIQAMREAHHWAAERWPDAGHATLIEKSANGAEIINELKRELTGVLPVVVSTDKVSRAIAAAPAAEAGNVYLPGSAAPDTAAGYHAPNWVASFIEEAATFPNGRYDDQVDAFTQAMKWIREQPAPIYARILRPPPIPLDNPKNPRPRRTRGNVQRQPSHDRLRDVLSQPAPDDDPSLRRSPQPAPLPARARLLTPLRSCDYVRWRRPGRVVPDPHPPSRRVVAHLNLILSEELRFVPTA
jgi:predicted phage terminase large subunit-like protein